MDEEAKTLLLDLSTFISPIAAGKTESPRQIRAEAEELIARVQLLIQKHDMNS